MTFDQVTGLLREFGFPVFVALWFMIRLERRVDRLSELLTSLMQATAIIAKAVEPTPPALAKRNPTGPATAIDKPWDRSKDR
jgi:hypothetical protein